MRKHFYGLAMGMLALSAPAFSGEPISEHTRQDMGLQKAIQLCEARGGKASWYQSELHRLHSDQKGYRLYGNELVIACPIQASPAAVQLMWRHPSARKDGSALPLGEIRGYQISYNGKVVMTGVVETFTFQDVSPGTHSFTLRTVDTQGTPSDESPAITVTVL